MERWQSVAADHDRIARRRCQIAKRRGAWVVGTTSSPEKARLARDAGADEVIRYTEQDFVSEVRSLTSGLGVHLVYDAVGRTTFDWSLDCIVPRRTMVLFGETNGRYSFRSAAHSYRAVVAGSQPTGPPEVMLPGGS